MAKAWEKHMEIADKGIASLAAEISMLRSRIREAEQELAAQHARLAKLESSEITKGPRS